MVDPVVRISHFHIAHAPRRGRQPLELGTETLEIIIVLHEGGGPESYTPQAPFTAATAFATTDFRAILAFRSGPHWAVVVGSSLAVHKKTTTHPQRLVRGLDSVAAKHERQVAAAERAENKDGAAYDHHVGLRHGQTIRHGRVPGQIRGFKEFGHRPDAQRADDNRAAAHGKDPPKSEFRPHVGLELDEHGNREHEHANV